VTRPLVAIFLLCCASASWGAATFTLEPANPTDGDVVRLRIDISQTTCENIEVASEIDGVGHVVRILLNFPDFCDISNPAHTDPIRYFDIGRLVAGVHTVDYVGCHNIPPPNPPCTVFRSEQIVVTRLVEPRPVPVPAVSWWALSGLSVGLFCANCASRRLVSTKARHRCRER
jgi:hypothetical protein